MEKGILIPVKDEQMLRENGIFFKRPTLYRWCCQGVHPELFVKIGRSLFINLLEWNQLVENAKKKSLLRIRRLKRIMGE